MSPATISTIFSSTPQRLPSASGLYDVVLLWEATKDFISGTLHVTHHALHIVLGLLLFVLFARISRRSIRSPWPLLPVLLLELLNEVSDFLRYYFDKWPWTPYETSIDIVITLAPPIVLILAARLWVWARSGAG